MVMATEKARGIRPTIVKTVRDPRVNDRMLYVEDIQELYGRKPDGNWRKSSWWVRHEFCQQHKKKAGRDCYWFESDALAFIEAGR